MVEGQSAFDESMLTGEAEPVVRGAGERIVGATLNSGRGRVVVRLTAVAGDTVLAHLVSLVEEAQASKAKVQRLADLVSLYFVPAVLVVAAVTWLVWAVALHAGLTGALGPAVAVLVIACPCALGLATPTAILAGTGRAARELILIRSAPGLEQTGRVTTVVFDKTGTLTEGRPRVTALRLAPGQDEARVLALVAAAEAASQHPLAAAVVAYAEAAGVRPARLASATEHAGRGIVAVASGPDGPVTCVVGRRQFLEENGIPLPAAWVADAAGTGGLFYAAIGGEPAAEFVVEDPIRPSSREAARALARLGVKLIMATGDRAQTAEAVAAVVGVTDVRAGLLPEDKVALVKALRAAGEVVAMVGDGLNDAPALAAADVGIAVGSGADIALDAAALVIPHGNLAKVADAVLISRRTMRIIRQNLAWAFMYNVLAIPVAAAGQLSPMIAAAAMAFSSVSVVGNSLRLRRLRT